MRDLSLCVFEGCSRESSVPPLSTPSSLGYRSALSLARAAGCRLFSRAFGWRLRCCVVCVISQGDPLQLFSLCEVLKSDGTGPEAKLTVKVIDSYWDKPMNFLPQGGGPAEGEEMEVLRKDLLPANPASQDQTPDLADLDKCAANLPVTNVGYRQCLLSAGCVCRCYVP